MTMGIFDFSSLKKSIQGLGQQVKTLRAQIEKLQREREDVLSAAAAKADVKAIFGTWLAAREAEFVESWRRHLDVVIRRPSSFNDPAKASQYLAVFAVEPKAGLVPSPRTMDAALCAILGATVRPQLFAVIDSMRWPDEGLPMAARAAKVAELDSRIDQLKREEAELVQAAESARIILD